MKELDHCDHRQGGLDNECQSNEEESSSESEDGIPLGRLHPRLQSNSIERSNSSEKQDDSDSFHPAEESDNDNSYSDYLMSVNNKKPNLKALKSNRIPKKVASRVI